jgi:predicted short-subunit dehydrogenase-like oxidoreductase (DUF2520 family)
VRDETVVVGAGRVGRTVAARLGARLVGRGQAPALERCRRLLLAVPDAAIEPVCAQLAPLLPADAGVVHFSGATSIRALAPAPGPVASVHPVQTVWPELGADQLEGAYAAVTGDWELGEGLARELGMTSFALADEAKPAYHAACAIASNALVAITAAAVELLGRAGIPREDAYRLLAPLQRRTLELADRPPTGPVARGDRATVEAHLEAVGDRLRPLYRELVRATLPLVGPEAAARVEGAL